MATKTTMSTIQARIPNRGVKEIFKQKFSDWFRESLSAFNVQELYAMMESGNTERVEEILNDRFFCSINYHDTVEAFYHGVALALMRCNSDYICTSNQENERFVIQCKQRRRWKLAFVLGFKVSDQEKQMIKDAREAIAQIKGYVSDLQEEGYEKIMAYGLAFCEKRCKVAKGETYSII